MILDGGGRGPRSRRGAVGGRDDVGCVHGGVGGGVLEAEDYVFELVLLGRLRHLYLICLNGIRIQSMGGLLQWGVTIFVAWVVLALLWYKVIKPYFRKEERAVRTSIVPAEQEEAEKFEDNECCICTASPKNFRVVATCAHSFCADCFFWMYTSRHETQVECPLCRKDVIAIFKAFSEVEPQAKIADIRQKIRAYNQRFGDDRSIKRVIKELPFVLTHTVDYVFSPGFLLQMLKSAVFIKGAMLLVTYLFLLPESVNLLSTRRLGVLGYLDDALLIVLVLVVVTGKIGIRYMEKQE